MPTPPELPTEPLPPFDISDEVEYERRSNLRPENYAQLSHDERRRIDRLLKLVDPRTGISFL